MSREGPKLLGRIAAPGPHRGAVRVLGNLRRAGAAPGTEGVLGVRTDVPGTTFANRGATRLTNELPQLATKAEVAKLPARGYLWGVIAENKRVACAVDGLGWTRLSVMFP